MFNIDHDQQKGDPLKVWISAVFDTSALGTLVGRRISKVETTGPLADKRSQVRRVPDSGRKYYFQQTWRDTLDVVSTLDFCRKSIASKVGNTLIVCPVECSIYGLLANIPDGFLMLDYGVLITRSSFPTQMIEGKYYSIYNKFARNFF